MVDERPALLYIFSTGISSLCILCYCVCIHASFTFCHFVVVYLLSPGALPSNYMN